MHQAPVTLLKERTFTGKLSLQLCPCMPPGGNPLALSMFTLYARRAWHAAPVVDYESIILSPSFMSY